MRKRVYEVLHGDKGVYKLLLYNKGYVRPFCVYVSHMRSYFITKGIYKLQLYNKGVYEVFFVVTMNT